VSTATATTLRETLLSALTDAQVYREDKGADCGGCRTALAGECPDHEGDGARADDYLRARAAIEAADTPGKLVLLLAGTEAI
jgi:hypothetical protein